jgi:hypothetical protein
MDTISLFEQGFKKKGKFFGSNGPAEEKTLDVVTS